MAASKMIDHFEVFKKEKLGSGGFGNVFKAKNNKTGEIVAAKEVFIPDPDDTEELERVQREVEIHGRLPKHDNIVHFIASKNLSERLWIFTELCPHGDLITYCEKHKMTSPLKLTFMKDVAKGILHLHHLEPPVAHRDIKPHNVLVTDLKGRHIAKLCDLGIAKSTEKEDGYTKGFMTRIGSSNFMAPEQFELLETGKKTFHKNIDIFSAGLLFYVLITTDGKEELIPILSNIIV